MATYAEVIYCKDRKYYNNTTRDGYCYRWCRCLGPWDYCSKADYRKYAKASKEMQEAWARWENDEVWSNE